jgi:hypothetical protein
MLRNGGHLCKSYLERIVPLPLAGRAKIYGSHYCRDLTTPLVVNEESSDSPNYMEGYLTKKGETTGLLTEPWTRRYFVLQDSDLYYYRSREDFQFDPKNSIKNRPIDLNGLV